MGNYSWHSPEEKDWIRTRMFYNDKAGIDKSCYMSIFGDLINMMKKGGFEINSFEFIPGVKNLRIDINEKLKSKSRESWLNLDEQLRGTGFFIGRSGIDLDEIRNSGKSVFLDLTPQFIKSLEKLDKKPLLASISFPRGDNLFYDTWFDYTNIN